MTTAPKLEVKGLSKSYVGKDGEDSLVLSDINLRVPAGQFVCIVGASGCGKTTFVKIVDGLTGITSGQVEVDGKPVAGPSPERGFVFQNDSLFPWRTVQDNILFGLEMQGRSRASSVKRSQEMIELVGLAGYGDYYPHELSGGMRQRVNLARALAMDPDILMMDEPFAALDAQTREIMQRELLKIWEARKKTVLFITHQIDEAIYLADRVLVFGANPGRIKDDISIDFPRPRSLHLKRTPEFIEHTDRIWNLIEEEVVRGMANGRAA
ncbi:NitT/TauT family transport system ATP-binding protein OS=Castellaniella defragrans OX=75697 GN=HNR28_000909 PE=4 SV=1 [Castellaniella defragrans]